VEQLGWFSWVAVVLIAERVLRPYIKVCSSDDHLDVGYFCMLWHLTDGNMQLIFYREMFFSQFISSG